MSASTNTGILWSLDPLIHGNLPSAICESIFEHKSFITNFYLGMQLLPVVYLLVHKMLISLSKSYKNITPASKQIAVLHHAVEAIVLTILFPIYSYFVVIMYFQVRELDDIVPHMRSCVSISVLLIIIYMMELSMRYQEPRPIVLFHHLLASFDGFLVVYFPTNIMLKTGQMLTYFITFEAITFIGLVMYRIFPFWHVTTKVMCAGMVIFGVSRILQLLMVGSITYGSWNDENNVKWQAIMQTIVTIVLTVLQLSTMKIHYGIWRRCKYTKSNKMLSNTECTKSIRTLSTECTNSIKKTTDVSHKDTYESKENNPPGEDNV